MKTTLLALLLLSCCSFFYLYENDPEDLVELAPDFFVDKSLKDSPKMDMVYKVFRDLKAAKGDFRSRKPELHIVKSTGDRGIAVAYSLSGVVKMELKGVELCESFGEDAENAFAVLLGHELVHIYEKHSWENLFAWEFGMTSLKNVISNEKKKDEVQADYLGGVLAYMAGYKVFNMMPDFLDKVYKSYDLKDENMVNYPGIQQRKLFATETVEKFNHFINLFEMANLLTTQKMYDYALAYYDEVLQEFKSREVYNNIGYLNVQEALTHFSPKENKFYYPLELDMVSRMSGGKGDDDLDLAYRERKLLDAIHYFNLAQHYDPHYPIAHLNKACANALLGVARPASSELEWMDATVSANRAINLSTGKEEWENTLADGHVALGIIAGLKKDESGAKKEWQKALALESDHILAKANLSVFDDTDNPLADRATLQPSNEMIDGIEYNDIDFGANHLKFELRVSPTDSLALWRQDFANSYLIVNESVISDPATPADTTYVYHEFHLTSKDYKGQTAKGISLENGTYKLIEEKYGRPHEVLRMGNGSILHYEFKDQKLIFQTGPNGKLMRWGIYFVFDE
ncbi:MAG: hypothetical protein AAFZ15_11510 [Bacteroidota bacterium]